MADLFLSYHDADREAWEWCEDWYGPYSHEEQKDPTGPRAGETRVVRGGALHDDAGYIRAAHRLGLDPVSRRSSVGFRVVDSRF